MNIFKAQAVNVLEQRRPAAVVAAVRPELLRHPLAHQGGVPENQLRHRVATRENAQAHGEKDD